MWQYYYNTVVGTKLLSVKIKIQEIFCLENLEFPFPISEYTSFTLLLLDMKLPTGVLEGSKQNADRLCQEAL